MALVKLTFEQCKWILKCYWKTENVTEVQRRWRNEFGTPPTQVTVTKISDKFEVDGTVRNVNKGRSGRPQRMMKVLRQCYKPTHDLQGSL
jgi:hypothetical protein